MTVSTAILLRVTGQIPVFCPPISFYRTKILEAGECGTPNIHKKLQEFTFLIGTFDLEKFITLCA